MRTPLLVAVVAGALATAVPTAWAQNLDACPGGIQSDDGTFEAGYGAFAGLNAYVMRVSPPGAVRLDRVCACFWRNQPSFAQDPRLALNVKVWRDEGGEPGELIASLDNVRADPVQEDTIRFFSWDVSELDVRTDEPVFVGVEWDASDDDDFFLCADQNGPGGEPAFFGSTIFGPPSGKLGEVGRFPDYRALGVRVLTSPTFIDPPNCQPSETAACITESRFRVTLDWASTSDAGAANAEPFSADTAYFWIFDPDNIEATVKVLNACAINNRYWVFAGGMTNLEMTLTVEDTETGVVRTYFNPQGANFQTVADTQAFATCP